MRFTLPILAAAFVALAGGAQASTLSFGFDGSTDGWTVVDRIGDTNPGNVLRPQATGGVTGGYLEIDDNTGGFMELIGPSALNGDLSRFLGGNISFFVADLTGNARPRFAARFGTVTISGGGQTVSADAFTGTLTSDFQEAGIRLSAADFGTTNAVLASILSDVSEFRISTESQIGVVETVAIDNFQISAVPLPAGGLLLLTGLAGLAVARRRKTS
ncbi:MAG: VPLPA-CTERM sorting domain-containing protein [Pseudomonadota bacterium]